MPNIYNQTAVDNINKLLKNLKTSLNNASKAKNKDPCGNDIYIDYDIYTVDTLVTFLADSLTYFNKVIPFTMFTFEDTAVINQIQNLLVQGAIIWAMVNKALIERGREYQITDDGVNFTSSTVPELLNTEFGRWNEFVKKIKIQNFNT